MALFSDSVGVASPRLAALLAISGAVLTACSASPEPSAAGTSTTAAAGDCGVVVSDAWVKAADSGMTAVFAVIANPGQEPVTITGATSPAAGRMEIHEVVEKDGQSVMQPKAGGLAVPAGGTSTLAPGGDHLMLLEIPDPIEPGEAVDITLICAAGSQVVTAQAKTFAGAVEQYQPSGSAAPSMK